MSCDLLETLKFSVLELQEHLDTYNAKREAAEQVSPFLPCKKNQSFASDTRIVNLAEQLRWKKQPPSICLRDILRKWGLGAL